MVDRLEWNGAGSLPTMIIHSQGALGARCYYNDFPYKIKYLLKSCFFSHQPWNGVVLTRRPPKKKTTVASRTQ